MAQAGAERLGTGFRYVVVSYPTWACSLLLVGLQES